MTDIPQETASVSEPGGTLADHVAPPSNVDPVVSARMAKIRRSNTKPELALRKELHARGLRFRTDSDPLGGRRTVDIIFPKIRLAVFVDGCFWHGCPDHTRFPRTNATWWRQKLLGNVERDLDTNSRLEDADWIVTRFWAHEDTMTAADLVEEYVRTLREIEFPGTDCPSAISIDPAKPIN